MINYEPNCEYQYDIEKIEEIYDLLSDLKDIEINEDEIDPNFDLFNDIKRTNKDVQISYNNLQSSAEDIENSLIDKVQIEFDDKINTYVYLVENKIEKEEFPFNSWSNILNKKRMSLWKPSASWLKVNNFTVDNVNAQYLSVYNGHSLIEEISKHNITELKTNLEKIKEYYNDSKRPEFKNVYDYFVFKDYKDLISIFHNVDINYATDVIEIPKLVEKKWTFYAGIELSNNWDNEEYKKELLLLLNNTGTEEDKKNFINVLLGEGNNPKGFISFVYERFKDYLVYKVVGINWDMVNDFLKLNKKLNLGLEDGFFESLEKIIKKYKSNIKEKGSVENFEYAKLNYYLKKNDNNNNKVVMKI